MKRLLGLFILFIPFMFLFEESAQAAENEFPVAVGLDDEIIDFKGQQAKLIINRTYAPIEGLFQSLGVSFAYDSIKKEYVAEKDGIQMIISTENQNITTAEGEVVGEKLIQIGNELGAPIRLLSEFFGYNIKYIPNERTVRIYSEGYLYPDEQFIEVNRNLIDNYFNIVPRKPIFLTFDDGPNKYTEEILNILKEKQAHATFFMIEQNMKKYPAMVSRMVEEGHYPGLHSVTHNKNKLYNGNPQNVANEMEQTRQTLQAMTGVDSLLTRVPYGSKPYMSQPYRDSLCQYNFKMWDWNIDTEDWRYGAKSPATILTRIKSGMQKFEGKDEPIVILLHDSKGTASMLPQIIDYVRQKGYEPVSYNPVNHLVVNYWGDPRL